MKCNLLSYLKMPVKQKKTKSQKPTPETLKALYERNLNTGFGHIADGSTKGTKMLCNILTANRTFPKQNSRLKSNGNIHQTISLLFTI